MFAVDLGAFGTSVRALMLLALAGCSGSEFGADVSGTASLDGTPLTSGNVVFVPADGVSNNAVSAVDSGGGYRLMSNRAPGLAPGKYRVSVTMHEQIAVQPGERSMVVPKLLTPATYADANTSGLEFDVKPGSNTIDLPLTSK